MGRLGLLGILWLLPLLFSSALHADGQRWYQVEVILFTQNSQSFRDSEAWSRDFRLPEGHNVVDLSPAGTKQDDRVAAFSRLSEGSLQLRDEATRIQGDNSLTLLLHLGWYQPGLSQEHARGVRIQSNHRQQQGEPPRLEGFLTLSLSRYLHMNADLLYREARSSTARHASDSSLLDRWQVYRLTESRRMRSSELHYLDHPLFGMLVLVTPYQH